MTFSFSPEVERELRNSLVKDPSGLRVLLTMILLGVGLDLRNTLSDVVVDAAVVVVVDVDVVVVCVVVVVVVFVVVVVDVDVVVVVVVDVVKRVVLCVVFGVVFIVV